MDKGSPTFADSLKEYGRGIAGGLIFSLPLLYTMEVWWAGFIATPERLLLHVAATFCVLLAYNRFAGLHPGASLKEVIVDSVEELGIGFVISAVVLYLCGQISADHPMSENLGKIVIEALAVAVGVSIGTAQLGGGEEDGDKKEEERSPNFVSEVALAVCGAVVIAANVAPTEEILLMAVESDPVKILMIAILSILFAVLILHAINFSGERGMSDQRLMPAWLFSGVITYAVALSVSTYLLWFFGRFDGMSIGVSVGMVVVLTFAATLGASAGRLLLKS